jgi:hypothetical protein
MLIANFICVNVFRLDSGIVSGISSRRNVAKKSDRENNFSGLQTEGASGQAYSNCVSVF